MLCAGRYGRTADGGHKRAVRLGAGALVVGAHVRAELKLACKGTVVCEIPEVHTDRFTVTECQSLKVKASACAVLSAASRLRHAASRQVNPVRHHLKN